MANQQNYNYEEFDSPYDNSLNRTDSIPSVDINANYGEDIINNPAGLGDNVIDGQSIGNFHIRNWIKSQNYKPKSQGFLIHGELGYIECMKLYVGSGGIIGGSLDIPDTVNPNSFHVAADGTTWWGANLAAGYSLAPAYVMPTGDAAFNSVTIHGRDGQALADAINSSADLITNVINPRLDTQAEEILGDYTFGGVGSFAMADDVNNGIWFSPTGILGVKAGNPTFTITTSGDATFAGELTAAFGTFGTITAGALIGTLTVGGRLATTIGSSIDASGYFISELVNSKIKTTSQEILADFNFGSADYAGAVKAGSITWNSSGTVTGGSGVAIYRKGIVGADSGTVTFSISATDGSAYFQGAIGSATSLDAPIITGGAITGAVIRAGSYATNYMELGKTGGGDPYLRGFVSGGRRSQFDNNSLEFWNSSLYKELELTESGLQFYLGDVSETPLGGITSQIGALEMYIPYGNNLMLVGGYQPGGFGYPILFRAKAGSTYKNIAHMGYTDSSGLSYLTMQGSSQRITSNQYMVDTHINFGLGTSGDSGYGFRQNSGIMQYKDSGGGWTAFGAGSGPSGNQHQMTYFSATDTLGATSTVFIGGSPSYYINLISSRINHSADVVAQGSLHATGNVYTGGVLDDDGAIYARQLSTSGSDLTLYTNRHLRLRAASGYNIYIGEYSTYDPSDINMNFTSDVNFYQSGTIKAVIDNNFWTDGNCLVDGYSTVGSYITAGGTIRNTSGDIICNTGNLQLLKTGVVIAAKDSGGTTRYLTVQYNATIGGYILKG